MRPTAWAASAVLRRAIVSGSDNDIREVSDSSIDVVPLMMSSTASNQKKVLRTPYVVTRTKKEWNEQRRTKGIIKVRIYNSMYYTA